MDRRRCEITWSWTNWTFGIWSARPIRYGKVSDSRFWGIDLGPLEIKLH